MKAAASTSSSPDVLLVLMLVAAFFAAIAALGPVFVHADDHGLHFGRTVQVRYDAHERPLHGHTT